ncbi:MAG TPA: hypothetical protein VIJ06_01870, partial [Methylovirgula sp.]
MKQRADPGIGSGVSPAGQRLEIHAAAPDGGADAAGAIVSPGSRFDGASQNLSDDLARARFEPGAWRSSPPGPTYAALDLGTNNCRLLIARPASRDVAPPGFKIVDSFSRIVRLGEGLSQSGRLSDLAIERTLDALSVCKDKMQARNVTRARLIATEACRAAENGAEFVAKVQDTLGLDLEIVDRETEAHLAAAGCAALADGDAESVILFDIGGGSSEVIWLERGTSGQSAGPGAALRERIRFWVSLKLGVVTLAEKFGGIEVSDAIFEAMVACVTQELDEFISRAAGRGRCGRFHLLGTSGTVTTIAGIFLNLTRYDRRRVDGLWMSEEDVSQTVERLRKMSY